MEEALPARGCAPWASLRWEIQTAYGVADERWTDSPRQPLPVPENSGSLWAVIQVPNGLQQGAEGATSRLNNERPMPSKLLGGRDPRRSAGEADTRARV